MKKQFKKGQEFGKWILTEYLGGGGNGEVWRCINKQAKEEDENVHGAIKLLKSVKPKSYVRFRDEATVIEKNSDIPGIIPMIDKFLPEELKEIPFYVMPVAEKAEDALRSKTIEEKIDAILQICETLNTLHKRGVSHRDIKPPNFLVYKTRFSIADFGLVDYPDKKDISLKNEEIGAKWTMAPEMRRESSTADSIKADIYSLAKTLWIILTEKRKGFDGQYVPGSGLELSRHFKENYTTPLDKLLESSTSNDPKSRPTMDEFIANLENWKALNENFHDRNQEQWFEVQRKLFPTAFPKRVIWEDKNDIITILRVLCSYDNLNHMFFPRSGGLDLKEVRLSTEKDCIELDFQLVSIVRPKRLIFESFGYDPEWNYFRLELDELEPSGVYSKEQNEQTNQEGLSEISRGVYAPYEVLENRAYAREQGYEISFDARHVTRWFRGSFVLFNKRSKYNLTSGTYDGRHNKMNTDQFREYVQRHVDRFRYFYERLTSEQRREWHQHFNESRGRGTYFEDYEEEEKREE